MLKFLLKRVGYGIVTMFIIITATFYLIHAVPGDPMGSGAKNLPKEARMAFRKKYGLDKPVYKQYAIYLKNLILKGDLGSSMVHRGRHVNDVIKDHAPTSAKIGGLALLIQVVVGITLGIIAGFNNGKWPDKVISVLVVVLICIPSFVFAALLQYLFSVKFSFVPSVGWGKLKHFFLPVFAMSLGGIAGYCKYMRNSTLGVIGQDYIDTAKAKGVSKGAVVRKHIVRNAIIPIITMLGPSILGIFGGSFVIEKIFSIPGLGRYFTQAVTDSDFSMIEGLTIFFSGLYIISLILVDVCYGLADPRIRVGKGAR